jgi:3-hydroxyacyl-[acyl-carrier-protein] dehydratase
MIDYASFKLPLNSEEIKNIIPHRYPFLLVDRITHLEDGYVKGYKNVTINDNFFEGHFPEKAVMPGVLIVEALAQTVCVSEILKEENKGKIGLFAGIDGVRFKSPVLPGDKLDLEAWTLWSRRGIGKCKAQASVDGKICCVGELTFALVNQADIK